MVTGAMEDLNMNTYYVYIVAFIMLKLHPEEAKQNPNQTGSGPKPERTWATENVAMKTPICWGGTKLPADP